MRIGIFGDVVGRSGRRAVERLLPELRRDLALDFVVVNAENAAGGFGITEGTAEELFAAGADVLTLGNHAWDQPEAQTYVAREPRLLRPLNYSAFAQIPGRGANLYDLADGRRVLVVAPMGRIEMEPMDCPFAATDEALANAPLREVADAIIVDMHAEATSEKNAMGLFCDGRASVVVGTHTHVPTADHRLLPKGTAYITDLGMCGDYSGVIGMKAGEPLRRFTSSIRQGRMEPADGEATVCGLYVETDDKTGLAVVCAPIRVGGMLAEATLEPAKAREPQ